MACCKERYMACMLMQNGSIVCVVGISWGCRAKIKLTCTCNWRFSSFETIILPKLGFSGLEIWLCLFFHLKNNLNAMFWNLLDFQTFPPTPNNQPQFQFQLFSFYVHSTFNSIKIPELPRKPNYKISTFLWQSSSLPHSWLPVQFALWAGGRNRRPDRISIIADRVSPARVSGWVLPQTSLYLGL